MSKWQTQISDMEISSKLREKQNMLYKILSFLGGLLCFIVAALLYIEISSYGFPDGHKTALQKAILPVYQSFIICSLIIGGYCIYLGFQSKPPQITKRLIMTTVIYTLLGCGVLLISFYLGTFLENGQGG